ncbi:MAG: hypothetical protein ACREBW_06205, partial [Candidatus Micrarchaeaceae archaeon]
KQYYLILITDTQFKEYVHHNLNKLRLTPKDIADEFWMLRTGDEMKSRLSALKSRASLRLDQEA